MTDIQIIKFIAPKVMTVNGKQSPCDCTDTVTCAYCVQASLVGFDKKIKEDEQVSKGIISHIKKIGVRKFSREIDVSHVAVIKWFKSGNIPSWVVKKYREVVTSP